MKMSVLLVTLGLFCTQLRGNIMKTSWMLKKLECLEPDKRN